MRCSAACLSNRELLVILMSKHTQGHSGWGLGRATNTVPEIASASDRQASRRTADPVCDVDGGSRGQPQRVKRPALQRKTQDPGKATNKQLPSPSKSPRAPGHLPRGADSDEPRPLSPTHVIT